MHTPAWELFPYERSTIFVREERRRMTPSTATSFDRAHDREER